VLREPAAFTRYREAGYRAVHARHTYAHRAATVLEALGLTVPPPATGVSTAAVE
jgi:spore maturation protein CgeB